MFCRHNRIWLSSTGWQHACAAVDKAHLPDLQRWAENDWPLVVRRSDVGYEVETIAVGLALPPPANGGRKIRIPLSVHPGDIARHEAPLLLAHAASALPAIWQAAFTALSHDLIAAQLEFRVYGSLSLQAMTGLPYMTRTSDIDVLFYPATHVQLQQGLHLLQHYAQSLPLDGEIVFPSGHAVAWKEWVAAVNSPDKVKVMVKSMRTVSLLDVSALLSGLEELS
ncbi:malonate decarboxylase holo-[acyl-carrier-protein] synthase [Herminiimonas sp. KBW02]|uniref:malonate decarboxylase holo-[acyl-carrier-protein] synthase n=1 Tax=Herminiimonas sp. KBW02 TaxID=2153363 RepID=UPI000F5AB471|nr:malonate decarboxylase holo-[acyl-carrier-protein] synthase [Herminiimonas sp. KBW02]RQO33634.1 malonate decarboxylase holo-[acyl-carrier-protein] synthase [Herminiimonas sp. KBW02]